MSFWSRFRIPLVALVVALFLSFMVYSYVREQIQDTTFSVGVLVAGIIFSALLFMLVFSLVNARYHAETMAHQMTKELREARDMAVEASRAKSEFLATMSHEIRTPLHAIVGMTDLLSNMENSPEQKQYLNVMKRASDGLLRLVNDILDLSKVEAGKIEIQAEEFELLAFVQRTVEFMAVRAHQKGLELSFYIKPGTPDAWLGDTNRIRQVLINLLENAIKFTEQGEVFVEISAQQNPEGEQWLQFSIIDTGIGIDSEKQAKIFNAFTQADSSTTRKYGGSGLGLSICKRMVEMMGGKIQVESAPQHGAIFTFKLPLLIASTSEKRVVPEGLQKLSVLIVNPAKMSRQALRDTLKNWTITVYETENAKRCLEETQKLKKMDLYVIDENLPDSKALDLAAEIKKIHPDAQILILLNSNINYQDVPRFSELNLAGYLVKPVKYDELLTFIQNATKGIKAAQAGAEKTETIEGKKLRPLKILLAEDNEDNRLLIQTYLQTSPCEIDMAENGEIAFNKFKNKRYDLVMMDMLMPVMDGYQSSREIRKWEKSILIPAGAKPVPIIALTANALQEQVSKSLQAGCTAHVTKPIKKHSLIEIIHFYTAQPK